MPEAQPSDRTQAQVSENEAAGETIGAHVRKFQFLDERAFPFLYILLASLCVTFLISVAIPLSDWLGATAKLQSANAELLELEYERQKLNLQWEIDEKGAPPERVTIEDIKVKEVEPSWLRKLFLNWGIPILGFMTVLYAALSIIFLLREKFGEQMRGKHRTKLSILSASLSVAGMLFAAIKYQSDLLAHAVGSYVFLSCLYSFIFFSLLLGTRMKRPSLAIYIVLLTITLLTGWFTGGTPAALINEYQALLRTLTIPHQALLVLGTILPIILVVGALSIKPDSIKT